jgi:hypothetical protein
VRIVAWPERRENKTREAISSLKAAPFKAVSFPSGLDDLKYDEKTKALSVPIEVPADRRAQPGALADYERGLEGMKPE